MPRFPLLSSVVLFASQVNIRTFSIAFAFLSLVSAKGFAQGSSFDSILEDLSQESSSNLTLPSEEADPFAKIKMHAGVSFLVTHMNLGAINGKRYSGFLNGVQLGFGIDLFSPLWLAEGSIRNYGTDRFDDLKVSLSEFDLKVIHRPSMTRWLRLRMGGGVAARYLQLAGASEKANAKYTTPASLFLLGMETQITRVVSFGADVGYRSALVRDTLDRSAIDANLRVEAHF